MAKSFANLVSEALSGKDTGLIFSDAAFSAWQQSLRMSHTNGGVVTAVPIVATDPSVQGHPVLYTRLDSAGKQQLCVRFGSGAIQILSTEPD